MPKNKKGKYKSTEKSILRGVKHSVNNDKNSESKDQNRRPVRQAVLNHRILGTPKIPNNHEFEVVNTKLTQNRNSNATLKRKINLESINLPKSRKQNLVEIDLGRSNGGGNPTSCKGLKRGTIESKKKRKIVHQNLGMDNVQDIDSSNSSDDLFDRFDRMESPTHIHEDDDIVDVSVGRAEDQDFGIENADLPQGSSMMSEKDILSNPNFEKLLQKIVNDKVEKTLDQEREKRKSDSENLEPIQDNDLAQDTSCVADNLVAKATITPSRLSKNNQRLIKSPSDTTLYAPALRQNLRNEHDKMDYHDHVDGGTHCIRQKTALPISNTARKTNQDINQSQLIDKISDFVEGIRISTTQKTDLVRDDGPSTSTGRRGNTANEVTEERYDAERDKLSQARTRANRLIIEAEQYKAQVETPKGRNSMNNMNNMANMHRQEDDEFFHISCHIDPNIKAKIEKGEFIELERLLPRSNLDNDAEDRMELVNRDGQMFFVSAHNKDNKIKNVRRWEQAFRVYAAIYSAANPHRSHEIWQYVYVINSAASCYIWEEVAQYDYMFRQLMSRNPGRSWAVTYTQMWQMTLRHVIPKGNGNSGNYFPQNNNNNQGNNLPQGRKKKYCWKFNRGKCPDLSCRYPHKCFYCDGKHGLYTCYKKGNRKSSTDKNVSPNVK